jgi:hypothetical protein
MIVLKRLDDLLWYNNKYIHKIEDTFFTFLTRQEIFDFYSYLSNNSCQRCDSCELKLTNKIEDIHPSLWNYNGCKCNYYRIALSNTYKENYENK